jgi:hypothetical protein
MTRKVQSEAPHNERCGAFCREDLLGLRKNHAQHLKDEAADH